MLCFGWGNDSKRARAIRLYLVQVIKKKNKTRRKKCSLKRWNGVVTTSSLCLEAKALEEQGIYCIVLLGNKVCKDLLSLNSLCSSSSSCICTSLLCSPLPHSLSFTLKVQCVIIGVIYSFYIRISLKKVYTLQYIKSDLVVLPSNPVSCHLAPAYF